MEEGDAFSAFAKAVGGKKKKQLPGAGPASLGRDAPIRKGGTVRDGSLGDFRAAFNRLSNVKDWDTEEYGLILAIVFTVIVPAIWGYNYVFGEKTEPKIDTTTELGRCLYDSYGSSEKQLCKMKYGGAVGMASFGLFASVFLISCCASCGTLRCCLNHNLPQRRLEKP